MRVRYTIWKETGRHLARKRLEQDKRKTAGNKLPKGIIAFFIKMLHLNC